MTQFTAIASAGCAFYYEKYTTLTEILRLISGKNEAKDSNSFGVYVVLSVLEGESLFTVFSTLAIQTPDRHIYGARENMASAALL